MGKGVWRSGTEIPCRRLRLTGQPGRFAAHAQNEEEVFTRMERVKATMKKAVVLVLTLSLLLTLAPAAMAVDSALPKVGDTVHGFTVKEIREFPLIGADLVLFEHGKTGAKLMYIANEDTNRVFDLTFLTEAVDDTGLPHVFEHSTLDGSEKYPSKALFFNLISQTYNTYMNAMTAQWYTTYPIGSLSEAQLLKFADYYTDSCLHPNILSDESIYREEAWRYRLPSEDAELTIEGTVYSEMLGAMTLSRWASYNNLRTAFPGSRAGNVSGGDPAYIPDMTWDMLKAYHDTYYHPSNCIAFLYGKFEDYTAFLKLLDDAFSPYEKQEFVSRADTDYKPITAPVTASIPFPAESGTDTKNASVIYYTIVCPGLKGQDELVLNTMTDLLVSSASSMQQSLKKALPSGSFSAYIDSTGPDQAVTFVARSVNKDDGELFKKTVDAALADVAKSGFPQDLVDAVMSSSAISTLLANESSQDGVGVDTIDSIAYYYAYSRDLWGYQDYVEALTKMNDWNSAGLYAAAAAKYLVGSKTTALTTTYPEPGLKEKNDAALAERLAAVKAAMSAEEIAALVAASNATEDDTADKAASAKYVAELKAVDVKSLPEDVREYSVTDKTENGFRHIDAVAGVDGVGKTMILLDAAGIAQEDLHWYQLYAQLTGELDTSKHSREEIATLINRYLYDVSIRSYTVDSKDSYHPYFRMSWTALDADLDEGYDLMREVVFDMKLDDAQAVLENVQALKASLKSTINGSPYMVQLRRSLAIKDEELRYETYLGDLDYYAFLEEVEAKLESAPAETLANLVRVRDELNNSTNAVAVFAGNEESIQLNAPLADKFLASLDKKEITPVIYNLPVPAKTEGLVVESGVQFNALIASCEDLGLEPSDETMNIMASVVQDQFLYPLLRDQYGAYGVWHGNYTDNDLYIISYRDPNVKETFDVYDSLPELVAGLDLDQSELDGYIQSAYVGLATPSGELSGAFSTAIYTLRGESQTEKVKTRMEELKAITPEKLAAYAEVYKKFTEVGARSTSGSAAKVNANADLYSVILDPFGIANAPEPEFTYTDVGEAGWPAEEVVFVWMYKLMDGTSETTFSPDQVLTKGDLSAAVYSLYSLFSTGSGEIVEAEEAMAWLSGNGLIDGEAGDIVTREELAMTIYTFMEAIGLDMSADGDLSSFADSASVSPAAVDAMSWAVDSGLINGMGDGTIAPTAQATRAQAASVLQRVCANLLGIN